MAGPPPLPLDPLSAAKKRVGETLCGKWRIDRLIDTGGMAAVFEATHRNGKKVAIKMLFPHISAIAEVKERFLREGYVANKVDHPGAVSVLDDDTTSDGAAFLVMELLEGESLEGWLARAGGTLRPTDVLAVADQVLDTLGAAHTKGVVHRDIKPANLFSLKNGQIKVLDFGLARLRDPSYGHPITAAGTIMGTAAYMPPEQARGKTDEIDARTDVYAMGAVMFRSLAGRFVHNQPKSDDRLFAAMKERAPALVTVMPDAPLEIAQIVDRALSFERDGRYATAAMMRLAVRSAYQALRARARKSEDAETLRNPALASFAEDEPSSVVVDLSFHQNVG
jgi:eukaryotic-like serine/threonine-protein kinase